MILIIVPVVLLGIRVQIFLTNDSDSIRRVCCIPGPVSWCPRSQHSVNNRVPLLALMARDDPVNSSPKCTSRPPQLVQQAASRRRVGPREREREDGHAAATVGRRAAL